MKETYITREVKELVYEATDGTQFKDKAECKKYEESAKCVLLTKYKPLVVKESNPDELFHNGSEDDILDVIKITKEEDIDTVMQLYFYYNSNEYSKERAPKIKDLLSRALAENDLVIIYRGYYDDVNSFYIHGTLNSIFENIKNLCNETN